MRKLESCLADFPLPKDLGFGGIIPGAVGLIESMDSCRFGNPFLLTHFKVDALLLVEMEDLVSKVESKFNFPELAFLLVTSIFQNLSSSSFVGIGTFRLNRLVKAAKFWSFDVILAFVL